MVGCFPPNTTDHKEPSISFMEKKTTQLRGGASVVKDNNNVSFAYFPSIEAAGNDWLTVAELTEDIFFQRSFLHAVEQNPPLGMRFGYLVYYKDDNPVGLSLCQIKHFSAAQSIADDNEKETCFFNGLSNWFKRRVSGWAEADILICGNLLVTGAHGFWFNPDFVSVDETPELLEKGLQYAAEQSGRNGIKIAMILVKDVLPEIQENFGGKFVKKKYTEFEIQPNMVLDLPFPDFDGYLNAMSTKYRTRAKRAFKKAESLQKKELSLLEVQQESDNMYALYKDVATNAGFNMVDLNEHYMLALHQALNGKFRVFGYYLNDELVCYCTTLHNNHELEAHFLGYNKSLNHDYQLYLNMLYDMIQVAFTSGCKKIVFARTALEIKSSVGAKPEQLLCYLRHQNSLINNLTTTILDYLKPVEEWQQRHPFKDN
jgi:Acetyltransferase (GNAT) domain